jgi:selenide,water dikinase
MVAASGVGARVWAGEVPLLARARAYADQGVAPGGSARNFDALGQVRWAAGITRTDQLLLVDPQTSGGLLLAVAPERLERLLTELDRAGTPCAAVVGEITTITGTIVVETGGR